MCRQTDVQTDRYLVAVCVSEAQSEVVLLQQVHVFTDFVKQLKPQSSFLQTHHNSRLCPVCVPPPPVSPDAACLTSTEQVNSEPSSRVTLACIILKLSGFLAGERVTRTPEDR